MIAETSLLTRLVSRLVSLLLRVLSNARFMGRVDMAQVMGDQTERILNLPGRLPVFPTKATDAGKVAALLRKLHPVICNKGLIRLGPNGDGGYLVPDDLKGIEACFSPGVSDSSGFERDCAELGMKVFMADGSIEMPAETHPQFNFIKKFIGFSSQGEFVSMKDWIIGSGVGAKTDLLLQMDIEGFEYETLLSLPLSLQERFRIVVVEFHYLDYLFSEPLFAVYSKVFEKLLVTHQCLHIHPNNICCALRIGELAIPQMAEFTFLRTDRVEHPVFATKFPHPLDRDNAEGQSLCLPSSCYRIE